ncbi:MAG TPA: arylsulfatase [Verrucomicrobia bacterium]|nr:arylsulfatase [Verrucomicrobiota bacterium]
MKSLFEVRRPISVLKRSSHACSGDENNVKPVKFRQKPYRNFIALWLNVPAVWSAVKSQSGDFVARTPNPAGISGLVRKRGSGLECGQEPKRFTALDAADGDCFYPPGTERRRSNPTRPLRRAHSETQSSILKVAGKCSAILLFLSTFSVVLFSLTSWSDAADDLPNIVLILGDDMGIDSVSALNGKMGLSTPHLDRLVKEGMSFMDAHSTSGVCSPTRYSVLTGRYHWRSRLKRGIVGKWERPLIKEARLTLPEILKQQGYSATMIGKWHLGWNWPKKGGGVTEKLAEIDFTLPITGGPNDHGFDEYFGDDVPNWPPYAWRENERLIGTINSTMKAGTFVGVNTGPAVTDWDFEAVLHEYGKRCSGFIRENKSSEKPWFLYFPMPSPHTPIAPHASFKGRSGVSPYADFLIQSDWAVGEVLKALDDTGQQGETLVIFTTDNGTSPKADFNELEEHGVRLREHWRGWKADAYEGGHRVPFIVRWPGKVTAGTRSREIISLTDITATLAEVVGFKLPEDCAEDSVSLMPLLKGKGGVKTLHEAVINHSVSGLFAVRRGKWKALFCRGSGGWSPPREAEALKLGLPSIQLYNLDKDPKETVNLYEEYPDVVQDLSRILKKYVLNGRSTPGPRQSNHKGAIWWRGLPWQADEAVILPGSEGK